MDTDLWRAIKVAVDELVAIRVQTEQGLTADRTVRFYDLIRTSQANTTRGGKVATVMELAGGWVIVHWPFDPKSVAYYSSITTARHALCDSQEFMLSLVDVSERVSPETARVSHTDTPLTPGERKIIGLLVLGLTNAEIADQAGINFQTVKNNLQSIYHKLGVNDRTNAALKARDLNLGSEPDSPDS